MADLVFGMNVSLDGFVDHDHPAFAPKPTLFQHFIDQTAGLTGSLYGRRMYQLMQYWDEDQPDWDDAEFAFAHAWRSQPKWVVSSTLTSVGPNATLVSDAAGTARRLRAELDGVIDVAGPKLAASLAAVGLVDGYRLYLHPVVLDSGTRFFAAPPPPLRLIDSEPVGDEVVRLTYSPQTRITPEPLRVDPGLTGASIADRASEAET